MHGIPAVVPCRTCTQVVRLCDITAVLISHPEGLLGLPMLIRNNPEASEWRVFSTLAALDVARHLASELCDDRDGGAEPPTGGNPDLGGPDPLAGCEQQRLASSAPGEGAAAGWEPPEPEVVGWRVDSAGPLDQGRAYCDCWLSGTRPIFTRGEIKKCFSMVKVG